jgi:hypothetical protein
MRNGRDRRSENPLLGHAKKERVSLIGTDQRFSSADGQYDRLPTLAAELVRRQVALIFIGGSTPAALAAKAVTKTIPIVFASGADPVALGLVDSLSRPGGNVTGVLFLSDTLLLKRLELLREVVPQAETIAFLRNPANPTTEHNTKSIEAAARSVRQQLTVLDASTPDEIDSAFRAPHNPSGGHSRWSQPRRDRPICRNSECRLLIQGGVEPHQSKRPRRISAHVHRLCAGAERRVDRAAERGEFESPRTDHQVGGSAGTSCGLRIAFVYR